MSDGRVQPNIVLILVDDMGYSDLGCYGGEVSSPHLDRLASNGVRFTDFYSTPRCCPSRASLLTGVTPHKAGVGWMSFDWASACDPEADGYTGTLNRSCLTIPEALAGAGYRSYISGKWHLTAHLGDKSTWPTARGFDRAFSLISGGTSYFHPDHLALDGKFYRAPRETYFTDLIGRYAERFVDEHQRDHPRAPFFLYLAFTAPHFPLEAPEAAIAKYRPVYAAGWDRLRPQRYERMKRLGIVPPEWELPPRPESIPAWDSLAEGERARQVENMATYAAMIEIMDANVGRLVAALERNGALENTLIMFLSDNGACAEGPTMGSKTHYGECWAHLSNTPLRLYKHFTCQGGVQTPFIAHWPAGIGARAGSLNGWTGSLTDVMPTCLELAGARYPRSRGRRRLHALDGVSLAPVLRGGSPPRPDIFVEHEGNQMVRSGRYKLVRQHTDPLWELYDMEQDRGEMHGLGAQMPERLIELARRYSRWEAQARVMPWERAGWFMTYHGYRSHGEAFKREYADAMGRADAADIVDGGAIGD